MIVVFVVGVYTRTCFLDVYTTLCIIILPPMKAALAKADI